MVLGGFATIAVAGGWWFLFPSLRNVDGFPSWASEGGALTGGRQSGTAGTTSSAKRSMSAISPSTESPVMSSSRCVVPTAA